MCHNIMGVVVLGWCWPNTTSERLQYYSRAASSNLLGQEIWKGNCSDMVRLCKCKGPLTV